MKEDITALVHAIKEQYPTSEVNEAQYILPMNKLAYSFVNRINANVIDEEVTNFFDFVNAISEKYNQSDIIEVGFIEPFTDSMQSQQVANVYFKGNAKDKFDELFKEKFARLF
jgi:hypothetical protein